MTVLATGMLAFGVALATVLAAIPLIIRVARSRGWVDEPGVRKVHSQAMVRVGGIGIVVGLLAGTVTLLATQPDMLSSFFADWSQGMVVIGAVLASFVIGFADDLKGLRARHKLLAQLVIAVTVCALGVRIEELPLFRESAASIPPWAWMSWPFTILWIIGVTNALNLIDGLDGLASGMAAIACAVLAVIGFSLDQVAVASIALAMCGALIGFYAFNRHPAKLYMGDCGSLSLGMFVAVASVSLLNGVPGASARHFSIIILAIGIPTLDVLYCMVRRMLERRSPFSPDRGHIHHRLLDLGFSHKKTVATLHLVALSACAVSMLSLFGGDLERPLGLAGAAGIILCASYLIGYFRLRKTIVSLRNMHEHVSKSRSEQRTFEELQLEMREAANFQQWWDVICKAALAWDFKSIELEMEARDDSSRRLAWQNPIMEDVELLRLLIPIAQRRQDQPLTAAVAINTNGSLEGSTRRFRFFARLLDEHNLRSLDLVTAKPPAPRPRQEAV